MRDARCTIKPVGRVASLVILAFLADLASLAVLAYIAYIAYIADLGFVIIRHLRCRFSFLLTLPQAAHG